MSRKISSKSLAYYYVTIDFAFVVFGFLSHGIPQSALLFSSTATDSLDSGIGWRGGQERAESTRTEFIFMLVLINHAS